MFGLQTEECYNSHAGDNKCAQKCEDEDLFMVKDFGIVGGAYGLSNEALMMKELRARGPISVDFKANGDFFHYNHGVFYDKKSKEKDVEIYTARSFVKMKTDSNMKRGIEFENVNHAVLMVGYG